MASTKINRIGSWNNFHFNGPFPTKILFDTDTDRNIVSLTDRYNDSAKEIQRLIQDSLVNNERLRAFGSAWSLSNIAHQKDRMLFNARLNIKLPVSNEQLHAASKFKPEDLFFIQCGTTIKEITEFIFRKNKSLKATGASNGQTIAGAISTGVHGSAIDVGSIQDCVAGINLITGPGPNDIVYIERHTQPAMNDDYAKGINSRVIRNDDLFNAALVSLGSFGVIHGVLIEAEDRYLLKRYVKKISRDDALEFARSLDFKNLTAKTEPVIPNELEADGSGKRPFHYKLYINPYNEKEKFVTEIMYKKDYRNGYPDPVPSIKKSIFKDLPSWVAIFAAKYKRSIPLILNALAAQAFPDIDDDIEGTLGEIFWDTTQPGAAFGSGFGIDPKDSAKALGLMINVIKTKGPVPGILSMRFVKASLGTLAFTRFPVTCILEIDGVLWEGNQNMISLEDFLTNVAETFKSNNIKFRLHWGKNGPWAFPGLVEYMYGDAAAQWKNIRCALLSKQMADLFSNDFLDTVKLSDYREGVEPGLIASLTIDAGIGTG